METKIEYFQLFPGDSQLYTDYNYLVGQYKEYCKLCRDFEYFSSGQRRKIDIMVVLFLGFLVFLVSWIIELFLGIGPYFKYGALVYYIISPGYRILSVSSQRAIAKRWQEIQQLELELGREDNLVKAGELRLMLEMKKDYYDENYQENFNNIQSLYSHAKFEDYPPAWKRYLNQYRQATELLDAMLRTFRKVPHI